MKDEILLAGIKLKFNDGEYVGECEIWGKMAQIWVNIEDKKDAEAIFKEKLEWLNSNKNAVLDAFMSENDHFVDSINEMIESGEFEADEMIDEDDLRRALFVSYANFIIRGENSEICVDLDCKPDYLMGHLAFMEISSEGVVEFGGLNG